MSRFDSWFGAQYTDLDEAYGHAQDCFEEDLKEIWADATGEQRRAIARERGALGITDKCRRDLTPTEAAILDDLRRALWLRDERRAPDPDDEPPF